MTSYSGYFGHIFSQWNEVETSHLSFGLVNAHTQSYFFTFFTFFLCKPHTLYVMFYDNICSLLVNFYLPAVDSPCHTTSMLDVHLGYSPYAVIHLPTGSTLKSINSLKQQTPDVFDVITFQW